MTTASQTPDTLVGHSRSDIFIGLSATAEQMLQERGVELAGALFGATAGARMPDAALTLYIDGGFHILH